MIVSYSGKQYRVKIYRGVMKIQYDGKTIAIFDLESIVKEKLTELYAKGGVSV